MGVGVAAQLVWTKQFWYRESVFWKVLLLLGHMLSQGLSTVGSACLIHLPAGMLGSILQYGVGIPTSKGVLPFFFPFQGVSVVP